MFAPLRSRRGFLMSCAAAVWLLVKRVSAEDTPGAQIADLKDQLEKGLRARRPEEFAFIARVLQMVDEGTLPLELVKGTFQWARKKADLKKYPFPYFEQALRIRAKRIGIVI